MANDSPLGELLRWTRWELLMDPEPPNPSLIVEGELGHPMRVVLEPMPELLVEPDYWPAKLLGYSDGVTTQVVTPFSIQIPLSELVTGKKGIELIGEGQSENIDIPGL